MISCWIQKLACHEWALFHLPVYNIPKATSVSLGGSLLLITMWLQVYTIFRVWVLHFDTAVPSWTGRVMQHSCQDLTNSALLFVHTWGPAWSVVTSMSTAKFQHIEPESEYCLPTNLGKEIRDARENTCCHHMGTLCWHAELFSARNRHVYSCEWFGRRGHPVTISFRITHAYGSNNGHWLSLAAL